MNKQRSKTRVALLSVVSNTTLVIAKLIVGLMLGSVSVISEAIHSGVDLLASLIALFAVKTSGKPADKEHPFGHGKFENISGTVEALLIFIAAGWIIYEAIKKISHPEPMETVSWGMAVMILSTVVNIIVSNMLFRVGKATDSVALQADAWHLKTDVFTSLGVFTGLLIIHLGKIFFPDIDLYWVDPVAAILVAMLIIKAAYDLTVESGRDLLDISLPDEENDWIRECILSYKPKIRSFHKLLTRKAGSHRFVQFHIMMDSATCIDESHKICDEIISKIKEKFPETVVHSHIEPCGGECTEKCINECLLDENERKSLFGNKE